MSKRNRRYGNFTRWENDGDVRSPSRTVWRKGWHKKRRPTEVHEAFWSFGAKNRTARLSDSEFNRQVGEEIGYLFRKCAHHGSNALKDLGNLVGGLMDLLF